MVGLRVLPRCMPETGRLPVNSIGGRSIFARSLFAVDISDGPILMRERVARSIEEVEFGDGGKRFVAVGIEGFDAELLAWERLGESYFLDVWVIFESACEY